MINSPTKNQPVKDLAPTEGIILTIMTLTIFWWQGSGSDAIAYFYGGGAAIVNTILQKWCLLDAAKNGGLNAAANLHKAYLCVIKRWIAIITLLAIGFAFLKLPAVPLTVGFIVMQLARIIGNLGILKQTYG